MSNDSRHAESAVAGLLDSAACATHGRVRIACPLRGLLHMLRDFRVGRLDVILPGGVLRRIEGREPGPHGVLRIHSPGLVWRIVSGGEVGLGEAYMDGLWDSPDLATLLQV